MVQFTTTILKFGQMGEKTGWTYIEVPADVADKLKPGNKKAFRVKGKLDNHEISGVALIPMGGGNFIMALNGGMRKKIKKMKGEKIRVSVEEDTIPYQLNQDLVECLNDEPDARGFFYSFPLSHQNYYSKWIEAAKTESTRTKRIAQTLRGLSMKMNYAEMIRYFKKEK